MPWLDDLRASTNISSNRQLASAMKRHPTWPPDDEMKVNALANQLNSANRGERLEWWLEGRGEPLFPVLAATLEVDELRLREAFAEAGGVPADRSDVFRFDDFPGLKPLDLRNEPAPPWIPKAVRRGRHGTWWHAPAGSGRTLAGRWLEVHEGWTRLREERWSQVVPKLPETGAVYIELGESEGVPECAEVEAAFPGCRLIVACPAPPPPRPDATGQEISEPLGAGALDAFGPDADEDEEVARTDRDTRRAGRGWRVVSIGPLPSSAVARAFSRSWYREVLGWVEGRLLPGGGLDLARVRSELEEAAVEQLASTPGDLLLLLGLLDEVGTDRVFDGEDESVGNRIGRAWWRAVLARLERHAPLLHAPIKHAGLDLVVQAEASRLARGRAAELSAEDWAELLPGELIQPEVSDELIEALRSEDPAERARALDEVRRPSPSEFIDALRTASVLRKGTRGFRLGPTLIADLVQDAARSHLLCHQPAGLGALLLRAETSAEALDVLVQAAEKGDWDMMTAALDAADVRTAAGAGLLDGLVRAVGWAALQPDSMSPPAELCRRLWTAQQPLLMRRWTTRLAVPVLQVAPDVGRTEPLTRRELWPLCRLAISRVLTAAGEPLPVAADNPWRGPLVAAQRTQLVWALTDGASALRRLGGMRNPVSLLAPEDRVMIADLGAHLYDRLGVLREHRFLRDWQGPVVLCEAAAGRLEDGDLELALEAAGETAFPLAAVEHVARARGVPVSKVLEWASRAWVVERPQGPLFELPERASSRRAPDLAATRRLWAALPPDRITPALSSSLRRYESVWPWLSDAQWEVVLAHLSVDWWERGEGPDSAMLAHAPRAAVGQLVREYIAEERNWRFYSVVWLAHPDVLVEFLPEAMAAPSPRVGAYSHLAQVLFAAPDHEVPGLLQHVTRWLESPALAPTADPQELRQWLAWVLEGRKPGWADAWEVLRPPGAA